ncbi:MAG: NADH-quinone oxidoreductase subunit A [Rickettsiaceae bacterium]|nr:MAG: NADH-quinone oxidoreductase subunit A [Rickettsiaceae bacterium]
MLQYSGFIEQYLAIAVFFGLACVISCVVILLPKFFAVNKPSEDKLSTYECGFDPFDNARGKFDIRFYLVAILFVIFDLEVGFIIPWAASLGKIGLLGFWSMMFFLLVLMVGFIFEWKSGALEW